MPWLILNTSSRAPKRIGQLAKQIFSVPRPHKGLGKSTPIPKKPAEDQNLTHQPNQPTRGFILLVSSLLFSLTSCVHTGSRHWSQTPPQVVGTAQFQSQVIKALELMRSRAPRTYRMVHQNIAIIQQGKRSGMWAYKNPPTFELTNKLAFASVTWCAATIAHDAMHSKLYHDHLRAYGPPVPANVWTGTQAERTSIAYQLDTLRRLGAPWREIAYCHTLDGKHYDLNRNGRYDWNDYYRRNW